MFIASCTGSGRSLRLSLMAAAAAVLAAPSAHAQITDMSAGRLLSLQQGDRYSVEKLNIATSMSPPMRITGGSFLDADGIVRSIQFYNEAVGQTGEPELGDLCFRPPSSGNFGDSEDRSTLTLNLRDYVGDTAEIVVDVRVGGDPEAEDGECRDAARVVPDGDLHPLRTEVDEDAPQGVTIPTAQLISVGVDPNGEKTPGQLFWNIVPPGQVVPAGAGQLSLSGSPGGGLVFTPNPHFNSDQHNGGQPIQAHYRVHDGDDIAGPGDGLADFYVEIIVNAQPDAPVVTPPSLPCEVGQNGGPCGLTTITDPDGNNTALDFVLVSATNGTVDFEGFRASNRVVRFFPTQGATEGSFTYRVIDEDELPSNSVTVPIVVVESALPRAIFQLTDGEGAPYNPTAIPDADLQAGESVTLDGRASLQGIPESEITAWEWTVNGQVLNQQSSTVSVRLLDGQNSIALVVVDADERRSLPATLQANVLSNNTAPSARISYNGSEITEDSFDVQNADFEGGESVILSAALSADPDGGAIAEYRWSLNGTQVQQGTSPTVTLNLLDGDNTIVLTVVDNRNGTGVRTVTARVIEDPDLSTLSGLTPSEKTMGGAISNLCPRLNATENLTAAQVELLDRCTDILNTDDPNAQRAALDALTPEEITSQQTTGIDFSTSQLGNLSARLTALRQGGGGGLSLAGLSLRDADGNVIPLQLLASLVKHLASGSDGEEETDGDTRAYAQAEQSLAAPWGFFINGNVISGEKDETLNEAAFDFGGWGITAGFDYRITDRFVVGLAVGYNESETDFASDGGGLDSEGTSTSIYGTYFNENLYVDFVGSSGALDYESVRNIVYTDASGVRRDTALGVTEGDVSTFSANFGYDFNKGGWAFGPTFALTSIVVDIDPFAETGAGQNGGMNLAFGAQEAKSRTAEGGFQFRYAASREWGVLSPQVRVAFVREFENDSELINVRFVNDPFVNDPNQPGSIAIFTDEPDTSYLRWGVGLSFVRTGGFSAFIDYEALAGFEAISSGELSLGLRFERSFK